MKKLINGFGVVLMVLFLVSCAKETDSNAKQELDERDAAEITAEPGDPEEFPVEEEIIVVQVEDEADDEAAGEEAAPEEPVETDPSPAAPAPGVRPTRPEVSGEFAERSPPHATAEDDPNFISYDVDKISGMVAGNGKAYIAAGDDGVIVVDVLYENSRTVKNAGESAILVAMDGDQAYAVREKVTSLGNSYCLQQVEGYSLATPRPEFPAMTDSTTPPRLDIAVPSLGVNSVRRDDALVTGLGSAAPRVTVPVATERRVRSDPGSPGRVTLPDGARPVPTCIYASSEAITSVAFHDGKVYIGQDIGLTIVTLSGTRRPKTVRVGKVADLVVHGEKVYLDVTREDVKTIKIYDILSGNTAKVKGLPKYTQFVIADNKAYLTTVKGIQTCDFATPRISCSSTSVKDPLLVDIAKANAGAGRKVKHVSPPSTLGDALVRVDDAAAAKTLIYSLSHQATTPRPMGDLDALRPASPSATKLPIAGLKVYNPASKSHTIYPDTAHFDQVAADEKGIYVADEAGLKFIPHAAAIMEPEEK
ncbi:MAG: hypothetical protein Q7T11_06115 [Deltaproteobacteria bacterium]|nr:hypothetical protein [Deltaproteobacteria bacterium]